MRLTKFRIIKYRSIEDSGEIPVDENITTFVGINESGKTNAMKALRKLNNASDTKFNELTEHPVWHFGNFDPNEIFITATFKLIDVERTEIEKIDSVYSDLKEISFSRRKNMQLVCHFKEKDQIAIPYESFNSNYLSSISELIAEINPNLIINNVNMKTPIQNAFDTIGNGFESELNIRKPEILNQLKNRLATLRQALKNISSHHSIDKITNLMDKIESEITEDGSEKVKNYLITKLPRFIYFENIGIIDSRINLPSLVDSINAKDLNEEERTAKTLLDLARLDPVKLLNLSTEEGKDRGTIIQHKDTLSQMTSQASARVTKEINSIWPQKEEHSMAIEVNGNFLRVWIINKDGIKLQLEERSRGYQWYFSFYVVFNVESDRRHKEAILLLDEPALFLHALAQKDFLEKALPQLAEKNQIIYTTHSPFMIDLNRPYAIHTVTMDKNSDPKMTKISVDHWASDKEALFPLQSAVGYHLAQSMFIGLRNFIVEGVTDFWMLSSASCLFSANNRTSLTDNFIMSPAGGGTKTVLLAKTYVSQDLQVGVLLDSDNEGKLAKEQLLTDNILKENKILLLNNILGKPDQSMSVEDIFPEDYYLRFVKQAYTDVLNGKEIVLESKDPMIVKKIEAFFTKQGLGKFEKSKPALAITKEFSKVDFDKLPPKLIENFEKVFAAINGTMKK